MIWSILLKGLYLIMHSCLGVEISNFYFDVFCRKKKEVGSRNRLVIREV